MATGNFRHDGGVAPQHATFTTAVVALRDEMRGRDANLMELFAACDRLPVADQAAIVREAGENGWTREQLLEALGGLVGDLSDPAGDSDSQIPNFRV